MRHLLLTTIATVLLVGCGPKALDISIHDAAADGSIEAVKEAIAAGADVNAKDKDVYRGGNPLHSAANQGHKEIFGLLINNGADVNGLDNGGRTPLLLAAISGQKTTIEFLISNGANLNLKRFKRRNFIRLFHPTKGSYRTKCYQW